jgi:hypothetical protein
MGRIYTVTKNAALTTAADLVEFNAPSTAIWVLHALSIAQQTKITAEQLNITLKRNWSTSGSGGSSATPVPLLAGDTAAGGTVEVFNTTRANSGTPLTVLDDAFDILSGWEKIWTPETRPIVAPGARLVWGLETAPAASMTIAVTAIFEEIG